MLRLKHLELYLIPLQIQTSCRYSWLQTISRNHQVLTTSSKHHSASNTAIFVLDHCKDLLTNLVFTSARTVLWKYVRSCHSSAQNHLLKLSKESSPFAVWTPSPSIAFKALYHWTWWQSDLSVCCSPYFLSSHYSPFMSTTLLPQGLCSCSSHRLYLCFPHYPHGSFY